MTENRTWPLELQDLGGNSLLASRAAESQRRGCPGEFTQVVARRGSIINVRFARGGYDITMSLHTRGGSLLYVTSAEMKRWGKNPVRMTFGQQGEFGLQIGDEHICRIAFTGKGEISRLSLPVPSAHLAGVSTVTRRSFCVSANSLAAWSVWLLLGACRCSHQAIKEILEIHDELMAETVGSLRDLAKKSWRSRQPGFTTMKFPDVGVLGDSSPALPGR